MFPHALLIPGAAAVFSRSIPRLFISNCCDMAFCWDCSLMDELLFFIEIVSCCPFCCFFFIFFLTGISSSTSEESDDKVMKFLCCFCSFRRCFRLARGETLTLTTSSTSFGLFSSESLFFPGFHSFSDSLSCSYSCMKISVYSLTGLTR